MKKKTRQLLMKKFSVVCLVYAFCADDTRFAFFVPLSKVGRGLRVDNEAWFSTPFGDCRRRPGHFSRVHHHF